MPLSPDQLKALQPLINTATQASSVLQIPLDKAESFLQNVATFVRQNHQRLGDNSYILILGPSSPEKGTLDIQTVLANLRKGKPVLYVDEDLHFIEAREGDVKIADCSVRTEGEAALGIRVSGSYVWDVLKGKVTNEGDVVRPNAGAPVMSKFHRPVAEFDLILKDHMDNCIAREQLVQYWKDPKNRILLTGPNGTGTELIFHRNLFWWLKNFVADRLNVYAEPKGLGQDKTDIIIVTISGLYVVEVKWLGKNEKNTTWGKKRINEGLAQVKLYLDNNSELVCGFLVIYDGRPLDIHQTESDYNDSLCHPLCEAPKILFLDSETPSKAAPRIAKGQT